ncbi:MAG TPA: sugar ABC transporter permease [Mycobacteriales bacterium]|nr:sugar ABC transporter permease [Mycobacteriales bacterium]
MATSTPTKAGSRPPERQPATPADQDRRSSAAARRAFWHRFDVKGAPYAFIAPFFLLFAAVGLFPLAYTAYVSLNDWDLLNSAGHTFIGLDNYRALLHDSFFWNALRNTVSIWVLSTVPQLLLALALAVLLNSAIRARTFFRVAVALPTATSLVAVTIIFAQLYARDFGLVNFLLTHIGFHRIDWQAGRLSSHIAIASMITWQWAGYNALIYLAGMQAIPGDLYEAAEIDGAGAFQRFRSVTVPLLRPTILFTLIISTIGGLQVFAQPLLFDNTPGNTSGGPGRQFQTLTLYMYEHGFHLFHFGYASAIAWTLFLLIVVVSIGVMLLTRRGIRSANES